MKEFPKELTWDWFLGEISHCAKVSSWKGCDWLAFFRVWYSCSVVDVKAMLEIFWIRPSNSTIF